MKIRRLIALPLLLLAAIPAIAQEDPCASPSLTLEEFVEKSSEQVSNDFNATASKAKAATKAEMASRANGDGLTENRLDLLKRAFLALNLGQVEQKDENLIFNFNPDTLNFETAGQFSPRVIVHKAELFAPLEQAIDALPEDVRQSRKDTLQKEIGDLDDVEASLRWTQASGTPRAALQRVATEIFEPESAKARPDFAALAQGLAQTAGEIRQKLGNPAGPIPLASVCENPETRAILLRMAGDIQTQGTQGLTTLRNALNGTLFFKLADLIDGQPRLSAEGSFRRRGNGAGPDERALGLRFDMGTVSYWGFKRWAARRKLSVNAAAVQQYLDEHAPSTPNVTVTVDYTKTPEFSILLPVDATRFSHPESHTIIASAKGGTYFGGGRVHRIEADLSYADVTDNPARQDRFFGTLSWVEKLNPTLAQALGGSDLTVTLVYANKPEFRGEVQHELSLRAGLKWSVGGTSAK